MRGIISLDMGLLEQSEITLPEVEALREAFAFLDAQNFCRTARLPLVASRQWKLSWEAAALQRFRSGDSNIHEVGVPKLYWRAIPLQVRKLFFALTLGRADANLSREHALRALYPQGTSHLGADRPNWTVVSRFGRYILRSHPSLSGSDFVYFGDDTLFLMQRSRELLRALQSEIADSVRCLDLCCGAGGVGLALPVFEGDLKGIDLNSQAIEIARLSAAAQGLENYHYTCCDALQGLNGEFDLIFGNPPTLSPTLTGKDIFHATGTLNDFAELLTTVLGCLSGRGRALFTVFSEVNQDLDLAFEEISKLLKGKRAFRYEVRREYPLGPGRCLRHCALELLPTNSVSQEFVALSSSGFQLPGIRWRRASSE